MIKGDRILSVGTPASGGISIISNDPVASGGGGGDNPPITDTLQVYYNADVDVYSDAGSTPAVDGDNIRQVLDQSGNSNTLNQTTASLQPLYKTTVLGNGNASIQGQNDALNFTTNISRGTTDDFTFYLVYKRDSTANTSYILRGTVSSAYPLLHFQSTSHLWRSNTGGTAASLPYTATLDVEIVAYTFDRTANEVKMYINNSLITTYSILASRQFDAFNRIFANTTYIINYGSALFYYAAHDATQVGQISDWLNTKYSAFTSTPPITSNLVAHFQADADNTYSDAGVTEAVDGNNIQQINDVSGNDNHLTQTNSPNQLVFKTDELKIAGNRYWQGSGSDFMDLTSSIAVDQSVGFTTFFVVQKSASTEKAIPFGGDITLASVGNWWNDSFVYCGAAGTYPRVGNSYTSDWQVIAVTYGLNANEIRVHKNSGYNGAQTASAFSDFNLTACFNFGLSGDRHSNNNVKYAEMLHYNQPMSDADVISISDWLVSRHNI